MSNKNDEQLQEDPQVEEENVEIEEAEAEAEAVENEFDLLNEELIALKDKYARVHADFDNIKKRLEREKYQAIDFASEKFAKDLLAQQEVAVVPGVAFGSEGYFRFSFATDIDSIKEGIQRIEKFVQSLKA